jgi:phenylacetate-coenzyme A ligase PaaK-like adenylate-forming protein
MITKYGLFWYNPIMLLHCDTERLRTLLDRVSDTTHSDFYRRKFLNAGKTALGDLPFLTRDEIVQTPPEERCYIPTKELTFTAYTSGTSSGNPLLLFFAQVADYHFDPSFNLPVKRALILYPPLLKSFSGSFIQQCTQSGSGLLPVFGDINNLAASAALLNKFECDTLFATPTIALRFATQTSTANIKLLVVASELSSDAILKQLRAQYPFAKIVNMYASAEVGQFILGPTQDMITNNQSGFVPNQSALIATELIDGELVITYDSNPAFPLIRYRTGDYFTITGTDESTQLSILELNGRNGVDVVRVAGFELRAGTLDDCCSSAGLRPGDYQLHIEPGEDDDINFRLEILRDSLALYGDTNQLSQHLLDRLYLAKDYSLRMAIEKDLIATIHIQTVDSLSVTGNKRRPLICTL